jgi:single-strand DNA-binding protein
VSSYLNRVTLIGNLGHDPEMRTTQAGNKLAGLSLATSESWIDKRSGERVERTEWHRIVIFNEALANIAERYLRKGSKILAEGQLQTREWTDNAGVKRYTTEIVMPRFGGMLTMLGKPSGQNGSATHRDSAERELYGAREQSPARGDLDDQIPF